MSTTSTRETAAHRMASLRRNRTLPGLHSQVYNTEVTRIRAVYKNKSNPDAPKTLKNAFMTPDVTMLLLNSDMGRKLPLLRNVIEVVSSRLCCSPRLPALCRA
jgi:hypothetical protein